MGDHAVYSASVRSDILPLFDQRYAKVLDIGCSTGNTGVMLKEHDLCQWVCGVEPFEKTASVARGRLDQVIVAPIEQALTQIEDESFDCILCLDVLEHLVDPWMVVAQLERKLKQGGVLITSIPNIRHIGVLLPLVAMGRWSYADSGILDRTHLRFFTKHSVKQLIGVSHLKLEKMERLISARLRGLRILSFGLLSDFLTSQYLTRSRKTP